jgi:Domain of unknown function (DUF1839)
MADRRPTGTVRSLAGRLTMPSLFGLDPLTYRPHELHSATQAYPETNCYADVLIELLHARGNEPLAALGATVTADYEGDQWTFFKPPPHDLETLFGIDIHEMQPYRPLPEQIEEQLENGQTLIVELDSWFMPDTASTTYHRSHVKTSAAMEAIDRAGERLTYFHNGGLYELSGPDYRGVLRLDEHDDVVLPPYTEIVRFRSEHSLAPEPLRAAARDAFAQHFARRPATNPFERFGTSFEETLPSLLEATSEWYHDYAFATLRMAGADFHLCAAHVDWLFGEEGAAASAEFAKIVAATRALSFKLARRRPFSPAPLLDELAAAWDAAIGTLARLTA